MKDKQPIPLKASLQNAEKYVLLKKGISAINPNIICANLNLALEAEYLPTLKQPQGLIPVPEFLARKPITNITQYDTFIRAVSAACQLTKFTDINLTDETITQIASYLKEVGSKYINNYSLYEVFSQRRSRWSIGNLGFGEFSLASGIQTELSYWQKQGNQFFGYIAKGHQPPRKQEKIWPAQVAQRLVYRSIKRGDDLKQILTKANRRLYWENFWQRSLRLPMYPVSSGIFAIDTQPDATGNYHINLAFAGSSQAWIVDYNRIGGLTRTGLVPLGKDRHLNPFGYYSNRANLKPGSIFILASENLWLEEEKKYTISSLGNTAIDIADGLVTLAAYQEGANVSAIVLKNTSPANSSA